MDLYGVVAVVRSYSGGLCLTILHKPSAVFAEKGVDRKSIKGSMTTNKYFQWETIFLHKHYLMPQKQKAGIIYS